MTDLTQITNQMLEQLPPHLRKRYLEELERTITQESEAFLKSAAKPARSAIEELIPSLEEGIIYTGREIHDLLEAKHSRASTYKALHKLATESNNDLCPVVINETYGFRVIPHEGYLRPKKIPIISRDKIIANVRKEIEIFSADKISYFYYGSPLPRAPGTWEADHRDRERREALHELFSLYLMHNGTFIHRYRNLPFTTLRDVVFEPEEIANKVGWALTGGPFDKPRANASSNEGVDRIVYRQRQGYYDPNVQRGWSRGDFIVKQEEDSEHVKTLLCVLGTFLVKQLSPVATLDGAPVLAYNAEMMLAGKGYEAKIER